MKNYTTLTKDELQSELGDLQAQYDSYVAGGLSLDMSRGKPSAEQLELTAPMLDILSSTASPFGEDGTDLRNYGVLEGIPEARRFMGKILDARPEQVLVGGSTSLTLMYDAIARAMTHGVLGSPRPWGREEEVQFLCPVPGYDRHFAILEHFGINMISVPLGEGGPDMDMVEQLVKDGRVKGIFCVPKYSNPDGCVYSDDTVRRMAALRPAAPDFRIFWDNAYNIHHLYPEQPAELINILDECERNGNPDMVYVFGSTAKITYPGAGVSAIAASVANVEFIKKQIAIQTIGADKLNMKRHAMFFAEEGSLEQHMAKHAELLRPRFEFVYKYFTEQLEGSGIARWVEPKGGYFISFECELGVAKEVVELCKGAGLAVTPAGSTHPYKRDPGNRYIRVAPSFPPFEQLVLAMQVFCLCVKLASVKKLLA